MGFVSTDVRIRWNPVHKHFIEFVLAETNKLVSGSSFVPCFGTVIFISKGCTLRKFPQERKKQTMKERKNNGSALFMVPDL